LADTNAETSPAKAKVAVFVSGTGTNMAALLYASRLPGAVYEIVLVAANDADAGGLQIAATEGVATFALSHKGMSRADHDAAMEKAALEAGAQYIALAGYMRILSPGFVQRWEGRMLNIHPSLLPKYPGLDTHARAIAAGDSHGGASVHLVTEELDAGEVLGQIKVKIHVNHTYDQAETSVLMAFSNRARPSVPPCACSTARSGCGIMPSTLPSAFRTPAMSRCEPLQFST